MHSGGYLYALRASAYGHKRHLGNLAWTNDSSGNRTSDSWNGFLTNYTVAANSKRLVYTTAGGHTRVFTHNAADIVLTDSCGGMASLSF